MGGEKSHAVITPFQRLGSPPHGRGKDRTERHQRLCEGITPAWAGKSLLWSPSSSLPRDHPRMGGEKIADQMNTYIAEGSPPHGRGKGSGHRAECAVCRITPAWAGKRLKRSHRSGIFISGPIPFHSVLHRPAGSGGSRAGRDGSPAGQPQNAGPA